MRLAITLGCLLGLISACGDREQRAVPRVAKPAQPALRLVALTDLSGYLEPCGCQSKPLGGIDKAATELEALRADHVPVLFVAAGDLLFGPNPSGASDASMDVATQETWKAEALVGILNRLGLAAASPGALDLSFGADTFQRIAGIGHFAWLPAKPEAGESPEAVAGWLGNVGDTQVGVLGISTFAGPERELTNARIAALRARAQAEIERLRSRGARVVLGLISSDQRSGRRLSSGLHGLDFVVQGGLGDPSVPVPSRAGDAVLLRAGYQGQGLLIVDVYLDGDKPFVDVSDWTRRETNAALQARVEDLAQRVSAWERDSHIDPANLNEQRQKLEGLRAELAKAQRTQRPSGNAFQARYQALTTDLHGVADVTALVQAYDARVNDHNKLAFADRWPRPLQPGAAGYVGSAKCQACHAEASAWWTQHAHGRAYTTLERAHKQYNLSCVACHVTGYEKPGGATVVHNEGLIHVGCESCHGPGSLHVAKPNTVAFALVESPSEATCKACHTPEHSDLFEFATYVARLRAPGHGEPSAKAEAAAH